MEHGDLDMLLNGLTAEKFENTAAIGQLGARPGQSLAAELQNYASLTPNASFPAEYNDIFVEVPAVSLLFPEKRSRG